MKIDISLLFKLFSFFKTLLWKNPDIVYINSNKKFQNKRNVDEVTQTLDYKWILCESNTKLGYKFYNSHLRKMK